MSTDGVMRLWDDEKGDMVFQFNYNGGMVQSVLVDTEEKVVLAAMQDAVIRVLNLTDPIPQARCCEPTFPFPTSPLDCEASQTYLCTLP